MSDKWIVLKFGGTSVAGRRQWETIANLAAARRSEGLRVLLVCSAVAGVTNRLDDLASAPEQPNGLDDLLEIHLALARDLEVDEAIWLPEGRNLLEQQLQNLRRDHGPRARAALLAVGEWLSTRIGFGFLAQRLDVDWADAREALLTIHEPELSPSRRWLSADCRAGVDPGLISRWSTLKPVVVTQGFVARTDDGSTALLGRGGSDTSAALLAGKLAAKQLEIWTDVPGLFSADPRLIEEARLLTEVDYAEALEMAASGAKVVNARSIRAAAETQTPVLIKDVGRCEVHGTRIGPAQANGDGVKTVTCQENMAVMLLQNLDARRQVGFLADVFATFRRRGVSVDLVATSETTTTVAVNCDSNHLGPEDLDRLADDLSEICKVKLFSDCVCINMVGRGARKALSRISGVLQYFDDHPLLMVSQSANDLCLSLLIRSCDRVPLLKGAHCALIPDEATHCGDVFGTNWKRLQSVVGL